VPTFGVLGQIFLAASPVNTNRVDESDRLRARVVGVVESYGLDLFDLQFRRESIGWVLRVMIDRPWDPESQGKENETAAEEPVTVHDCSKVSQDLSAILDVEPELVGGDDRTYTLEVSSPGLDRPLTKLADYARFSGEEAQVHLHELTDGVRRIKGILRGIEGDSVLVETESGVRTVPFAVIDRGRLVPKIEWRKAK
jgi:ribosome maturation factor RimP